MRWQDLVAKLTGKTPATDAEVPGDAGVPGVPGDPLTQPATADDTAKPQAIEPPDPIPDSPPESVEPMPDSQHANSEPSPRQALSAYNVQDDVKSISGRRGGARGSQSDAVSRVYSRALLEMAEAAGQVDAIADEVDQIEELLRSQPALQQMLETPAISRDQRRELIDRVFKGRVSDTIWRFLQVVNRKNRAGSVPSILTAFQQLLAEKRGIVEVNVTVAQRLEAGEAQQVATRIGQAIGKQVVLHQFVDQTLIGGMVIRIGDRVIDGSVATQLRNMRKQLIERGRDRARSGGAEGTGA